jgi:hypothetical protein
LRSAATADHATKVPPMISAAASLLARNPTHGGLVRTNSSAGLEYHPQSAARTRAPSAPRPADQPLYRRGPPQQQQVRDYDMTHPDTRFNHGGESEEGRKSFLRDAFTKWFPREQYAPHDGSSGDENDVAEMALEHPHRLLLGVAARGRARSFFARGSHRAWVTAMTCRTELTRRLPPRLRRFAPARCRILPTTLASARCR